MQMQRVCFRQQSNGFGKDSEAVPLPVTIVCRNIQFAALSRRFPTSPCQVSLLNHQSAESVVHAVWAFPARWEIESDMMADYATDLSEQDMADLAAYYATLE